MITTSLTFPVSITYESDSPLDIGDIEALREEIESSLLNANSNGELDPHGYTIQCVTLEVGDPVAIEASATGSPSNKIPVSDEDALRYLFTGLSERGWSFLAYDDGGDDKEPFESIEGLVSAVLAVDCPVKVYLSHKEIEEACLVLLAQDSPEDVLVDHTWVEPLNSDTNELWRIFD